MAKGVADARHGKGLSKGEANENERRGHTETSYRRLNEKALNNYDWSRHGLNFEIVKGKIVPLGSQKKSMYFRFLDALKNIDFKAYKDGATNRQNTYAGLIFSGSTAHMQRIAFGDQKVDYTRNPEQWRNWGVTRSKAIEDWAMDTYNFACEMYGEENILGFDVHLDETAPHIHCKVVPTAIKQQRGNISGYHKVDADGNPVTYQKGKHVGEVIKISDKKYAELSEEKKKDYRPNVRGTVRTISYASYFGRTLGERAEKLSELHTKYYEAVGKKWGLDRGDVISDLPEEEQRKRRHRTKEEAYRESKAKKARELAEREAADAIKIKDAAVREMSDAVRAKNEAVEKRDAAIDATAEQQRIIDKQRVAISSNNDVIQQQEKKKAVILSDIEVLSSVKTQGSQDVERYVKALPDITFPIPKEVRTKLTSPLRNHPRIELSDPPLTADELWHIAMGEIETAILNKSLMTSNKSILEQIKAIQTDYQTIMFAVVGREQKKAIMEANKELYKDMRKRVADSTSKTVKYDELERSGITKVSYEQVVRERNEAQATAKRVSETENMLEFAWKGVTKAKNVLIDPALDNNYMTPEQKKDVLECLRRTPRERLADIRELIKYACSFREIPISTRAEAIELAADGLIKAFAEKGYDLIKDATALIGDVAKELKMTVANAAQSAASAAVCLIYDYLDGATTISQGCGGGGGDTGNWRGKKDDEDDRRFIGRCLMNAVNLMKPKPRKIGYHR